MGSSVGTFNGVGTGSFSGSFSGSFRGDGSQLTGITANASAGGSNTNIQFNKSNVLSGSSTLSYDYDNNITIIQTGVKHKTYRLTSSSYNVQVDDYRIGVPYTLTGSVTIYLPNCQLVQGQEFSIKDEGGNASINNIVLQPSGSQKIDGQSNAIIAVNYTSIKLYNDANNWFIE